MTCLIFTGTMNLSKVEISQDSEYLWSNMLVTNMDPDNTSVINHYSTVRTITRVEDHIDFNCHTEGPRISSCRLDSKYRKTIWISNKLRNKRVKMTNGNRIDRNVVKIHHWNAGNKLWQNKKVTIEALLLEKQPDLLFVSRSQPYGIPPDGRAPKLEDTTFIFHRPSPNTNMPGLRY